MEITINEVTIIEQTGGILLKLENCTCSDYQILRDEFGIGVALVLNGDIKFRLYDKVQILNTDNNFDGVFAYWDESTYIPKKDDVGRIISFRDDPNDCIIEILIEKHHHYQRIYVGAQNIKSIINKHHIELNEEK